MPSKKKKNPNRLPKGVTAIYRVSSGAPDYYSRSIDLKVNDNGSLEVTLSCGDSESFSKNQITGIEYAFKKLKPEMPA